MGSDTVFSSPMHVIGTYLDLERLTGLSDKRRMKRLIHIGLGHGDVILKPSRNRLIHLMNDTKSRIAVFYRRNNDPYSKKIVYLIESLVLIAHLLIYTEEVLDSTVDVTDDSGICNSLSHIGTDILNVFLSLALSYGNLLHKIIVNIGFKIFK